MTKTTDRKILTVKLSTVAPWPGLNPRRTFPEAELQELGASIKRDGLLQPVSVAPSGGPDGLAVEKGVEWWLFAGERRLRASKLAGLKTIDIEVHAIDEPTAHRLAGLENLAREDLNVIEEARWLEKELQLHQVSQRDLAKALEKSQSWIANRVRLLKLPEAVLTLVEDQVVNVAAARDVLLPVLKLDAELAVGLLETTAKKLRKDHKAGHQYAEKGVEEALRQALKALGFRAITSGSWVNVKGFGHVRIPETTAAAFLGAHKGRSFQGPGENSWTSGSWWTADADAWREKEVELAKAHQAENKEAGLAKADLEKVRLGGPEVKGETELGELERKYGHQNVVRLDEVASLDGIERHQVTKATVLVRQGDDVAKDTVLVYVGADARGRKNAFRSELQDAERKAGEAIVKKSLQKAPKNPTVALVRGLLEALLQTDLYNELDELLQADGVELPEEWTDRWGYVDEGVSLAKLELSDVQVLRLASGLSTLCSDGRHGNDARAQARVAAAEKMQKRAEKRIAAWLKEAGANA